MRTTVDFELSHLVPSKDMMASTMSPSSYDEVDMYLASDHFSTLPPPPSTKKPKLKNEEDDFDWQKFLSDDVVEVTEKQPQQEQDWYHTNTDLADIEGMFTCDISTSKQEMASIVQPSCYFKVEPSSSSSSSSEEEKMIEQYLLDTNVNTKKPQIKSEEIEVPQHISRGSSPISAPSSAPSTVPPSRASSPFSTSNRKRKMKEEPSSSSSNSSSSSSSYIPEEDVEVKKEKNRVAAQRYRQKLREEAVRVNEQVNFFEAQNELIRTQIEAFRRQIEQDRKIILHLQLIMSLQNQNNLMENKTN